MHRQCGEERHNHRRAYWYVHWHLEESHCPDHLIMIWGIGDLVGLHVTMIGVFVAVTGRHFGHDHPVHGNIVCTKDQFLHGPKSIPDEVT